MSSVVVDASVALAWCFPDEASEYADGVLVALKGHVIVVPAVWGLEVANAMLVGERRKRLKQPEILRFVTLLEGLPILQDCQTVSETVSNVLPWRVTMGFRHTTLRMLNWQCGTMRHWLRSTKICRKSPSGLVSGVFHETLQTSDQQQEVATGRP